MEKNKWTFWPTQQMQIKRRQMWQNCIKKKALTARRVF